MHRVEFDTWTLVILRRPPDAPDLPEDELDTLQQQHLAHLRAQHEQGDLLVYGPFSEQPDESWRGMCIYRTSIEETRVLAEADPSVVAGRLAVDVLTWWTEKGTLDLGGA